MRSPSSCTCASDRDRTKRNGSDPIGSVQIDAIGHSFAHANWNRVVQFGTRVGSCLYLCLCLHLLISRRVECFFWQTIVCAVQVVGLPAATARGEIVNMPIQVR